MGVVHLAQGPDGRRVALKVLRPHIVGDSEARERLAREVSSLRRITSPRIAEILDADPHGPVPYVVTRYVPGLSLYHHVAEEGPIAGGRPAPLRRLPRRGAAGGPLRRGAAPRHQADQRADGGPLAGPHRLRPGPGGRGPAPHPDRLAARDARLPRAGDPVRRRREPGLRRARLGGDRGRSRRPAVRRTARVRRWRSWTGYAAASTTSPASRSPLAGSCASRSRRSRWTGRRCIELRSFVRRRPPARPSRGPPRREPELWTMPIAPAPDSGRRETGAGPGRAVASREVPAGRGPADAAGRPARGPARARGRRPYQQPDACHPSRRRRVATRRPGRPASRAPWPTSPRDPRARRSRCAAAAARPRRPHRRRPSPTRRTSATALVAARGPAPAHRLGHPAAARPAPDGPRPAQVVRRADDHPVHARLPACSPSSVRSPGRDRRPRVAGAVLAGLPARSRALPTGWCWRGSGSPPPSGGGPGRAGCARWPAA